jgi:hypothetical protein
MSSKITKSSLYEKAKTANVKGRSKMNMKELQEAIAEIEKPKKKSSSSKKSSSKNLIKIRFKVMFVGNGSAIARAHFNEIINWYRGSTDTLEGLRIDKIEGRVVNNIDYIYVEFERVGEPLTDSQLSVELQFFIDNDEDGNYPLLIRNKSYLVHGRDLEIL